MSITLMRPALVDAIFTGIRDKALICARPTRVLQATERRLTSVIRSGRPRDPRADLLSRNNFTSQGKRTACKSRSYWRLRSDRANKQSSTNPSQLGASVRCSLPNGKSLAALPEDAPVRPPVRPPITRWPQPPTVPPCSAEPHRRSPAATRRALAPAAPTASRCCRLRRSLSRSQSFLKDLPDSTRPLSASFVRWLISARSFCATAAGAVASFGTCQLVMAF